MTKTRIPISRYNMLSRRTKGAYHNGIAWTRSPMLISLSLLVLVMYFLLYMQKYNASTPAPFDTSDYVVSCLEGCLVYMLITGNRPDYRIARDTYYHIVYLKAAVPLTSLLRETADMVCFLNVCLAWYVLYHYSQPKTHRVAIRTSPRYEHDLHGTPYKMEEMWLVEEGGRTRLMATPYVLIPNPNREVLDFAIALDLYVNMTFACVFADHIGFDAVDIVACLLGCLLVLYLCRDMHRTHRQPESQRPDYAIARDIYFHGVAVAVCVATSSITVVLVWLLAIPLIKRRDRPDYGIALDIYHAMLLHLAVVQWLKYETETVHIALFIAGYVYQLIQYSGPPEETMDARMCRDTYSHALLVITLIQTQYDALGTSVYIMDRVADYLIGLNHLVGLNYLAGLHFLLASQLVYLLYLVIKPEGYNSPDEEESVDFGGRTLMHGSGRRNGYGRIEAVDIGGVTFIRRRSSFYEDMARQTRYGLAVPALWYLTMFVCGCVLHMVHLILHNKVMYLVQESLATTYRVVRNLLLDEDVPRYIATLTASMDRGLAEMLAAAVPFVCILMLITSWVYELHIESVYYGRYNKKVRMSLILGFTLFLVSEAVLFAGLFWVLPDRMFALPSYTPPIHTIEHTNCTGAPLFGTVVLLLSGYYANQAYYVNLPPESFAATRKHGRFARTSRLPQDNDAIELDGIVSRRWDTEYYHCVSVLLGIVFLAIQIAEYQLLPSGVSYNALFSIFFVLTGFHGLHVVVGLILLTVSHGTVWLRRPCQYGVGTGRLV